MTDSAIEQPKSSTPLFLYISPARLIILSIASMNMYAAYWIYKNWRYIKEREGLNIKPFWRGVFSVFFIHSLLQRIHNDSEARAIQHPKFSPVLLATVWVVLILFANLLTRVSGIEASIASVLIPSFLCLVPVQSYINSVTLKRNPSQEMYRWSFGHTACLIFGIVFWGLLLVEFVGYEKAVDIASPFEYENEGVAFQYPGNWEITEDSIQKSLHYIFIESPGNAIIIVQIYPIQEAVSLNEFVNWFSEGARQETPIGQISKSTFTTRDEGIEERFTISVFGEQIPHIREFYVEEAADKVAFIVAQAPKEDLSKVRPGFDLVLGSFVVQ